MDKTVVGEENLYLKLESRQATGGGIYEDVPGDKEGPATTTAKTSERQAAATKIREPIEPACSCDSDAVIVRRLLCIITAVVVLSFLTAAATLILAITMMTIRNSSMSATDCVSVQGSGTSVPNADYTEFSKDVQDLKQNVSSLKETYARHFSNMASLQMLINSSRQDMRNELTQIWTSVNSTGKDLQENAKASWLEVLNAVSNTKMELQQKINNISKMAGPIGPPGFNGSQGPAGPAGSIGAPGPKGAGNFSACKYHEEIATTSGGDSDAYVDEPSGSIIMAATCSTNYALECNLATLVMPQTKKRRYICNCKGTSSNLFGNPKTCYLHYWLCPIS